MTASPAGAGFGIVEGFYGRPWTREARIRLLRQLAGAGLDTYAWAPKDDPSHRARWRSPLSPETLREIEELAKVAHDVRVDVVHGISPLGVVRRRGLFGHHAIDPEALRVLLERVRTVAAAGVGRVALLFDDTWPTLLPGAASTSLGRAHGHVARAVADVLPASAGGRAPVLLVPAIYHRRAAEQPSGGVAYLRGIAAEVGRDIPVAWTGPQVFSSWIAPRDVDELERATGLRVFVWNNAIANDWLPLVTGALSARRRVERLSTGPITNMAPDLVSACAGVLLNGSCEAELSRIGVVSLGDFVRAPATFDASASWSRAIDEVFGDAAPAVRELLDRVRGHPLCAPHARDWSVRELAVAARRGDTSAASRLVREAERLAGLEARLASDLADHPAWPELRPTAIAIRDAAVRLGDAASGRAPTGPTPRARFTTDLEGSVALFRKHRARFR